MSAPRYAVYYAPGRDSPWWRFGAGWLGRDEVEGQPLPQPRVPGVSPEQLASHTEVPRRYGFHATLKAPFRLRAGATEALLRRRLAALAGRLRAVPLGALAPARLDSFVALVPAPRNPAVEALGAHCVLQLDDLRAPLTPEELARRKPDRLDAIGRQLLERYGYPHVLGRFRFHMSLSGDVGAVTAERLAEHAGAAVAALNASAPPVLDRLCLFRQEQPGAAFLRVHEEALPGVA